MMLENVSEKRSEMKKFELSDKLTFGKFKGEEIKFVYVFQPDYIEWLIQNSDWFYVDYDELKDVHTCKLPKNMVDIFGVPTIISDPNIHTMRDFLEAGYIDAMKEYESPPEQPNRHIFSTKTIKKFEEKKRAFEEQNYRPSYHEYDSSPHEAESDSYENYGGPNYNGERLSDRFIDDVLDGNPDAYWNID